MNDNPGILRRIPLTVKMVILTLIVGISIWAVLDYFVNRTVANIFEEQLTERLNSEVTSYRYRFGRYVYSFNNLAKLVASRNELVGYAEQNKQAGQDTVEVTYHREHPEWFPGLSSLRAIAVPSYAFLLDSHGKVREVYQSKKDPPPVMLLNPPVTLLRRSLGVSYLTSINNGPYLVTTEPVTGTGGEIIASLMLANPIDSDFLLASQGRYTENIIIALVTGDENTVLVSSHPSIIPEGSPLEKMYGQHVSVKQDFFEYGDSEMNFKFTSLVPKDEVLELTDTLVSNVRQFRAIIAVVFISAFILITYYITRRIVRVTNRVSDFSRQITGEKREDAPRGDQLYILEDRFNRLTEEVLEARETIKKQAEEKTRLIVNQIYEAIITMDVSSMITSWNPAAEKVFGWDKEEVVGEEHIDIIFPAEFHGMIHNAIHQFMQKGTVHLFNRQIEIDAVRRNGTLFSAELSISPAMAGGDNFFIVMVRDISERKKSEEAVRLSEEKFSKAFSSSPVLMTISTLDEGRLLEVNETFLFTCGYRKDEVVGRSMADLGIWADPSSYDLLVKQLTGQGALYNFETKIRVKRGEIITVLLSADLTEVEGKQCILVVALDLSERKKLENQLLHAQKMEAVGHLAGGIAHDFNNILTAIIGYGNIMLMKQTVKDDHAIRSTVKKILVSADKAAGLVKSLLAFSRKQIIKPKPVDVNTILAMLESLLLRLISEDIQMQINLADKELFVMADSGQIEQVIMNLATNARDAMPNGGVLTIETNEAEIDRSFIAETGYGKKGPYAVITVKDTGIGMDKKTRENIFEPFFTTKEVGKGTGLGMSMIFGIIKQHEGFINVQSEPGEGTSIQILLPRIEAERSVDERVDVAMPGRGHETILVAEDDEIVRELTREILEHYGYKVIEAFDGIDALDKFMKNKDIIHGLILDMLMPGRNGREVYNEINKVKPEMPVLFVSGYSGDILGKKGIAEDYHDIIFKPVTPHDLLMKLREVMRRKVTKNKSDPSPNNFN